MPYAAISSFSLFRRLGPLHLERRDERGAVQPMRFPFPQTDTLAEFGRIAHDRLGVGAVELCQIQIGPDDQAHAEALRAALDEAGVKVLTVPIDVGDLTTPDDGHRADDIARITRWFGIAQRLGAEYVRVNAGSPLGGAEPASIPGLVNALGQLADRAQALGLQLLLENHGGRSSDPAFMLNLLDEVGRDRLGLILDIGNFEPLFGIFGQRMMGAQPATTGLDLAHIYDQIARLAPAATLVHAKTYDPAGDGTPLLDVPRALRIVADSGFTGPVSVESTELQGDPWDNAAQALSAVRTAFPALQ